jgi:hypothetical protein
MSSNGQSGKKDRRRKSDRKSSALKQRVTTGSINERSFENSGM